MYIPFEEMPATARVWIYQANRPLSEAEEAQARQLGQIFTKQWAAHGNALRSSVQIFHQYFLVIAVDEQHNAASGCSIDSSVAFVRELEHKFSTGHSPINFFDRTQVAFWQDNEVQLLPMNQAKQAAKAGQIQPDTITFDNTVPTVEALKSRWTIPVQNSWLARYLSSAVKA